MPRQGEVSIFTLFDVLSASACALMGVIFHRVCSWAILCTLLINTSA